MSKFSAAYKLSDELGTSLDEALQLVDEAGESTVKKWLTRGALGGSALGGAGVATLLSDHSDEAAQARQGNYNAILSDSSLTTKQKAKLLAAVNNGATAGDQSGGNQSSGGFDLTSMLADDPAKVVIGLIVVLAVLNNATDEVLSGGN